VLGTGGENAETTSRVEDEFIYTFTLDSTRFIPPRDRTEATTADDHL